MSFGGGFDRRRWRWGALRAVLFGPNERERQFQPSRRLALTLLTLIILMAAGLRVYRLGDLPAGFFCDEAGLGYNVYSLLRTGRDETGAFLPLYVWSFDVSYKNPVFIYSAAIPVTLFGLNEFAVRLTSAAYGVGTVAAMFFLGRALMGPWVGLLAAAFLAVCPWHLHFSRIAFELITFPFFFVIGLTCLVRYTQGRRLLAVAMLFLGYCLYTYAIAKLFVPLFLVGFVILCRHTLRHRWGESVLALGVLLLTVAPVILFDLTHQKRALQYVEDTTIFSEDSAPQELLELFSTQYRAFLSPQFLFEQGDRIPRHAVRGHGELYPFFAPLILIGLITAFARRDHALALPAWWLVVYPIAPALMTEIPSATRGIIGAPAFCLLAAMGAGAILRLATQVTSQRRWSAGLQLSMVGVGLAFLVPQVYGYWRLYAEEYPRYSAKSYTGFQFGHREVVEYFVAHRDEYDQMILTPLRNNQPKIFLLFYSAFPPERLQQDGDQALSRDAKMQVGSPTQLQLYDRYPRLLFAVTVPELDLFENPEVRKEVTAPDGSPAYVLVELQPTLNFVRSWQVAGPYPLDDDEVPSGLDPADPEIISPGGLSWRQHHSDDAAVDLHDVFADDLDESCAWAVNVVHSETDRRVRVRAGFDDSGEVWINGERVRLRLKSARDSFVDPEVGRARLRAGRNTVALKTCDIVGDWKFYFRLTDRDGKPLGDTQWEY